MSNELAVFDPMMALVAQNIKNREATPEESLIIDVAIVNNENQRRSLAWLAREGKTWKNIVNPTTGENFTSFEEYGKFRLNLEKDSLYLLANSYRIEEILKNSNMLEKEIPLRSARELNKLPDSAIPEVYQQAIDRALSEGKKIGAKHVESVVQDYLEKNKTLQNQLDFATRTYEKVNDEYSQLQNQQQQIIDAKVSEGIAKAITENQQAIAEEKRKAENAQAEIERLKRDHAKAVAEGVKHELSAMQNEIDTKQYQIDSFAKRIEALREVELSLEREVGYLQTHKKAITKIKDNLSFLTVSFTDAFDTACIPGEVLIEWESIHYALSKVQKQLATFLAENRESAKAIESELVEIETPWDDENDEAFA